MKEGGAITIEAKAIDLDSEYIQANAEDVAPGRYVQVTISDTGCGMPAEVMQHVFEPFFTTKEKGKGTGLGLAMVHGFIKQSKGIIKVYSEPGVGTSFHIYVPAIEAAEGEGTAPRARTDELPRGTENILLVEDEVDLGEIAEAYLQSLGYQTTRVDSAEDAIALLDGGEYFDLVLTDIVMPGGMDGIAMHKELSKKYPDLRFVYASGFSEEALKTKKGQALDAILVNKPFRKPDLARAVRQTLDG
jgi:CheY-like chemotaxis protein